MKWLDRALSGLAGDARSTPLPISFEDYQSWLNFQGLSYPYFGSGTLTSTTEEIPGDFEGLVQGAYKGNGIVFACMLARARLFSEARFQFRRLQSGRPGELFGNEALTPLETPWTNATTGDLLMRAITDVDLAGNFYGHRPGRRILSNGRVLSGKPTIRRLRPDWVTIVLGSQSNEEDPAHAIDVEVAAYIFEPGGHTSQAEPIVLAPEEVAHFAPIPDPIAHFRGMSWLTPILREVMGDGAATNHKLKFFEGGGTPNMVVTAAPPVKTPEAFDVWRAKMDQGLKGLHNAFTTLYLQHGATAEVVGSDLKSIDFKAVQGAGETRIAAAAGVPAIIAGLSEGLENATYSNYGQARRAFADLWARPTWRNFAGSISTIIDVPKPARGEDGVELWYDDRDIPFLAEDVKDAAEAQQVDASSIASLVDAGYKPDAVIDAVTAGDLKRLKGQHTGLYSVQLQKPLENEPATDVTEAPAVESDDDDEADAAGRLMRALLNDE